MNLKSFIWIIVLILLISSVCAYDSRFVYFDTGDIALNGSAGIQGQSINNFNWTNGAGCTYNGTIKYNGTLSIGGDSTQPYYVVTTLKSNYSLEGMFYDSSGNDTTQYFGLKISNGADTMTVGITGTYSAGTQYEWTLWDGAITQHGIIQARSIGWHKFLIYNKNTSGTDSQRFFCVDNNCVYNTMFFTPNVKIGFDSDNNPATAPGYMDNFYIYMGNITPNYPSSNGGEASGTINLSSSYPPTNTQYNYNNISLWLTANLSYSNTNASLWLDGILNQTRTLLGSGTNVNVSFSKILSQRAHNFSINVYDNTTNKNSTTNIFYTDMVIPTITTNFLNNSIYYLVNISALFNFTDDQMLHRYNISIDGVNIQGNNSIDAVSINVSFAYNVSSLSSGLHLLNVTIADGHTATSLLGSYDFNNGLIGEYSQFNFNYPYKMGYIKINQKGGILDNWQTERKADRYSIIFKPFTKSTSYTFTIEADDYIYIVDKKDSDYGKWLIYNEHWIDFMPFKDITIKRITDNLVEVTLNNVDDKLNELVFNSIGDLNIVTKTYNLYKINSTISYSAVVMGLVPQTISLSIDNTGTTHTNAGLIWNGNSKSVTKTTPSYDYYTSTFITSYFSSDTSISFNWNYNITGTVNSENGTLTYNQTIVNFGIDNCTTFTTRAFNFTVINSSSLAKINSTADGYFGLYFNDVTYTVNFNLSWIYPELTHGICINPATAVLNLTGQMEFFINSIIKTYYISNSTISNQTQNVNIYYDDGTTQVTFTVTDENDNPLDNVYITVLIYDFGTNTYLTSEILKTDTEGHAIGNIVLNSQWYKFIVTYNNKVYLETTPIKLITTTYSFQISLTDDYFTNYNTVMGISGDVTFTNTTKYFSYTFTNPTGSSQLGCLKIRKISLYGDTVINQSCVNAAASTINLAISEATGSNTYIGTGTIGIGTNTFILDEATASFNEGYKTYGKEGIFVTFLLVLTLTMIGIWSPIIAVVLMVLGFVLSIILGIFYLSWGMMIGFIILGIIVIMRLNRT